MHDTSSQLGEILKRRGAGALTRRATSTNSSPVQPKSRATSERPRESGPDADGNYRDAPAGIPNSDADWEQVNPGLREEFINALTKSKWPVYIHGKPGRGKTSAAAAAYRRWHPGRPTWLRLGAWIRLIQACKDEPQNFGGTVIPFGADHFWDTRIIAPSLLIVDDLGVRTATEPQRDIITELMDLRRGKPTIYTGNHSPARSEKPHPAE